MTAHFQAISRRAYVIGVVDRPHRQPTHLTLELLQEVKTGRFWRSFSGVHILISGEVQQVIRINMTGRNLPVEIVLKDRKEVTVVLLEAGRLQGRTGARPSFLSYLIIWQLDLDKGLEKLLLTRWLIILPNTPLHPTSWKPYIGPSYIGSIHSPFVI